MAQTTNDRSRRGLQWTLGLLAAVLMISGVREVLWGARGAPGDSPDVSATVDGELRYANVLRSALS